MIYKATFSIGKKKKGNLKIFVEKFSVCFGHVFTKTQTDSTKKKEAYFSLKI
jgi:hypothetical protein